MPNNYILLDRIELNATAASVTFDNLNTLTGYTDLKLVVSARDTSTAGANWNGYSFTILPNGLSTNITQRSLFGNGSSVASYADTSMFNVIDMGSDTANTFSNVEIYVPNYTSNTFKSFSVDGVAEANATNTSMRISAGLWSSTAAITSLRLNAYSVFAVGSTFSLYGVAKLGTTPTVAPKASGGNIIGTDGTYWYHAFLSSGTFTPQTTLSADVLVVAGGGGGGSGGSTWANGGGGGAGGLLAYTSQPLAASTSYVLTVGSGGAGGVGYTNVGTNGNNSQFASLTSSIGGGRGGGWTQPVATGGSGGGGAGYTSISGNQNGAAGTSGQGFGGGTGTVALDTNSRGGGGGGATAAGGNGNTALGGAGGTGSSAYSAWATATNTGSSGSYAGGGGGGCGGTGGSGSAGGGNGGSGNSSGANATANTGSGGGGAGATGSGGATNGGNGSSGIIILRYPV